MYAMLLRWLPAPLAKLAMALWYGALLLALWLAWVPEGLEFRYGQI